MTKMGIASGWQPPLAATWMVGRVGTFLLMERWHGWHGRWYPAVGGVILLLGGFGLAVLSPHLGSPAAMRAGMIGGLAGFGIGMATIYTAALYYAMEVQNSEVSAGGTHEALIGVGYTAGPACGLLAAEMVVRGPARQGSEDVIMLGLVGAIAVGAVGVAAWRAAGRQNRGKTR
jgi:hypothetical protein